MYRPIESIGSFCVFKVVLRFNITVRSDFRSEQIEIGIILLHLHEVSARAHRSSEELEGKPWVFKHGQK